jgi:uncharacterized protein YggU (UPF0235/DUF167 family)
MPAKKCYSEGPKGVSLRVKAKPGARRDAIRASRAGELVVEVRARPEKGRANEEIRRVLAEALAVPRDEVVLKLGAGSRHKAFAVPRAALPALDRICAPTGEAPRA